MIDEETEKKVHFIENCIKALNKNDFKLMVGLFFEKSGTKPLMNSLHLSKAGLYKRKNCIISKISKLSEKSRQEQTKVD